MKKISFFLATLLMAFTFAACGSDDDDVTGNGGEPKPDDNPAPSAIVEMKISVLVGTDDMDYSVPRLLAEWEDNMFAQVVDPKHPNYTVFQYMNNDKANDVVAVVTEHNIFFMQYNPATDKDFPEKALVASDDDGFSTLSSCKVDWKSNEINYGMTVPLRKNTKMATRGEYDALKKPFFDMFDEISDGIDGMDAVLGKMGPVGTAAKTLCAAWTKVAIPLMKYNLYADDEIGRQEYIQEYFQSAVESAVGEKLQKYICGIKKVNVEDDDVSIGTWMAKATWRIATDSEEYEKKKEELVNTGMQAAQKFCDKVVAAAPIFNETQDVPDEDDEVWWDEDDEDDEDDDDELDDGDDDDDDDDEWGDGDDDDDDDEDGDDDDDEDDEDDVIGWTGTTWNFSGTLTIVDTDDGTSSENVSMTIEFPESGGVNISGGDISELVGGSRIKFEETRTGVIITISGSSHETSGSGSTDWNQTLTLNHTSATQATMDWSGREVWSGWYYIQNEKHTYSGSATFSGQFTGTLVK
jgi:hypothetical protein